MARRIGLVLSGGGVRGFAHAGVLRVLDRAGIVPHVVVGVSMGAIVGAAWALNPAWYGSLKALHGNAVPFRDLDPAKYAGLLGKVLYAERVLTHMYSGWGLGEAAVEWAHGTLRELTAGRALEDAAIPVIVTATDLVTGERVALRSGSAAEALYASSALAGILPPARIGNRLLADGGYADLAPVDLAREAGADLVVAVDVTGGAPNPRPANGVTAMLRSFEICQAHHAALRFAEADCVIRPIFPVPIETLALQHARRAIAAGARAARSFVDEAGG